MPVKEPVVTSPQIHSERFSRRFADLNKLLKKFENMVPHSKRFSLVQRNVHDALCTYKEIYDGEKQAKQSPRDIFMTRLTPPQEEPQAGPSGGYSRRRHCYHGTGGLHGHHCP